MSISTLDSLKDISIVLIKNSSIIFHFPDAPHQLGNAVIMQEYLLCHK